MSSGILSSTELVRGLWADALRLEAAELISPIMAATDLGDFLASRYEEETKEGRDQRSDGYGVFGRMLLREVRVWCVYQGCPGLETAS